MLKIGIIGLGDIAEKAYLPIVSGKEVDIFLCTRNKEKLEQAGRQYRIKNLYQSIDSLIQQNIQAAFVHSATASHEEIVEKLLLNKIHVFVDKPITYAYSTTERLLNLARQRNLHLMVGFNRRFAPAYVQLNQLPDPNMVVMQKNRKALPADFRQFIFDDFIHVVDTIFHHFQVDANNILVSGKMAGEKLQHVVVQFMLTNGGTAIGIMNRDAGTTEEKLEVFASTGKREVYNLVETVVQQDQYSIKTANNDWQPTLHKRGFDAMIDHFLKKLSAEGVDESEYDSNLQTHKVCEIIVEKLGIR